MKATRKLRREIAFLLAAAAAACATAFIPTKVATRADLAAVEHGLPFAFVIQDASGLSYGIGPESSPLPQHLPFLSPLEFPTNVSPTGFFADAVVLWAMIALFRRLRRSGAPNDGTNNQSSAA